MTKNSHNPVLNEMHRTNTNQKHNLSKSGLYITIYTHTVVAINCIYIMKSSMFLDKNTVKNLIFLLLYCDFVCTGWSKKVITLF